MKGSYLGPRHTNEEIEQFLKSADAPYERLDEKELVDHVAKDLAEGKVVVYQGRMEFGPRASAAEAFSVMLEILRCNR